MSLRLAVHEYGAPLARRVQNSRSEWTERRGAVLELSGSSGELGRGEAAPLPGSSSDSLADASAQLERLDPLELERLAELGSAAPADFFEALAQSSLATAPSARFALETALIELVARRRREPCHRFLRAACRLPEPRAALGVAALLDPAAALADAERWLAQGFTTLKLKVGLEPAALELERIRELRARLGTSFRLRLDANGAFAPTETLARLEALAQHAIEFVEEPTAAAEFPLRPPTALALDESLPQSAEFPAAHYAEHRVTTWVLKPSVLGGITRTLALARRAANLGCDVVVSHAFEGPIALAAHCELALALGAPIAQGLGPHAGLGAWRAPLPAAHRGPELRVHDEPGLGLPAALPLPGQP